MFFKNSILIKSLLLYLIYVFVSAIVFIFIQKPTETELGKDAFLHKKNIDKNNDRVALIESGSDGILTRLNMIDNAQKTIDMSYYTITGGRSVDLILASLFDAADRGVEVRIIFDGIFHGLGGEFKDIKYAFAKYPNISFKLYEPLNIFKPRTWHDRLHDKLIIVDNNLALIGGRNIGDKYFDQASLDQQYSKDRDVLVYNPNYNIEPSSLNRINEYFNEVFNYQNSESYGQKLSKRKIKKGKVARESLKKALSVFKKDYPYALVFVDWKDKSLATAGVEFIYNPIGRGNQEPWVLKRLLSLANNAKESILIQSPYVILSKDMEEKFKDYDLNTDIMRILTNSMASSPNPIAFAGYYNSRQYLVDHNISIYEYQGLSSLHGKTYIYDGKISAVGSFNFDARSTYINSEIMVLISSEEFAKNLTSHLEKDIEDSLKLNFDLSYKENINLKPAKVSWVKNFLIKILSKLVYFFDYLL